jgi:CMP-N-acetylneuraminic acid synthetase
LSTDDEEIAEAGRRCGLDVPFLRPANLAQDDTPMLPVVRHALRWIAVIGESYDAVCLLQPTNPLRKPEDIDGCIDLLETTDADAVVTVQSVPTEHNPHWVYFKREDGLLTLSTGESNPVPRRQDLPPAFHREGSVYAVRYEVVMVANSLYGKRLAGYAIDPGRSVNIDSPEDWANAERLLSGRRKVNSAFDEVLDFRSQS